MKRSHSHCGPRANQNFSLKTPAHPVFPQMCACQIDRMKGWPTAACKFLRSQQNLSKQSEDKQMLNLPSKQIPLLMQSVSHEMIRVTSDWSENTAKDKLTLPKSLTELQMLKECKLHVFILMHSSHLPHIKIT